MPLYAENTICHEFKFFIFTILCVDFIKIVFSDRKFCFTIFNRLIFEIYMLISLNYIMCVEINVLFCLIFSWLNYKIYVLILLELQNFE